MTRLGFLLRGLRRNALRAALTAAAIALSIFLVCAVLTLPQGFRRIVDEMASNTRISVHAKGGLTYLLPASALARIRAIPGVTAATSFSWFGGIYDEPKNLFPNFAVDVDAAGDVWPEYGITPQALADFRAYRDAALVGHQTMRKFGWKVGDRITLRGTLWPVDLDLRIVGTIEGNPVWLLFSRVYLEEAVRAKGGSAERIGMIWARVSDPARVEPVMRQIEDLFRNSETETAAETEKSFFQNFMSSLDGILRVFLIVGFLVVAAVVFIAANTASMSIRERRGEIAVLKALGFRRRLLFEWLLGETLLLALVGGVTGAIAAFGLLKLLAAIGATGASPGLGPLSMFVITVPILVEGIFLSLVVGLVAGFVPAFGAARKPVAAALREVF